ncbi:MAG TPA: uL15m family ribosomal protein, partial [Bacteroidia bacterium]|nr:uL15m family ribosomal protein [Bacteroidia bacterium]
DAVQQLIDKHNITDITLEVLIEKGLVAKRVLVKILGRGEIKAKANITAHAFSATAKQAIESLGGTASTI